MALSQSCRKVLHLFDTQAFPVVIYSHKMSHIQNLDGVDLNNNIRIAIEITSNNFSRLLANLINLEYLNA